MSSHNTLRMSSSKKNNAVTSDRAAQVSRNPLFKRPNVLSRNEQQNIVRDDRFAAMFNDPKFEISSKDKRGRPVHYTNRQLTPQAFYGLKTNEKPASAAIDNDKVDDDDEEDDDDDKEEEEESEEDDSDDLLPRRIDKVRGIGLNVSNEEAVDTSDSELDEADSSAVSVATDEDLDGVQSPVEDNVPLDETTTPVILVEQPTRRIAVQHLDWSIIRSRDLLVLFRSFCPEGGQVRWVTIYPSKFGMERLTFERVSGPPELAALRDRESSSLKLANDVNHQRDVEQAVRRYQSLLNRYYLAVIECDSVATADAIYQTLDGYEFEKSGCTLELSFVPDDMIFDIPPEFQNCVSRCERAPRNYKINPFFSKSKLHTKLSTDNLSWDTTPRDRARYVASFFREDADPEHLEQDDMLGQVLRMSSSEDEDEELKPRLGAAEMRALLLGDEAETSSNGQLAAEDEDMATDEEDELMKYVNDVVVSDDEPVLPLVKTKFKRNSTAAAEEREPKSKYSTRKDERKVLKQGEEEERTMSIKKSTVEQVDEVADCKKKQRINKRKNKTLEPVNERHDEAPEDGTEKKRKLSSIPQQEQEEEEEAKRGKRRKLKRSQLRNEHMKAHRRKKKQRLEEQLTQADQDGELALLLHPSESNRSKRSAVDLPAAKCAAVDSRFAALRTDPRYRLDPNAPDFRSDVMVTTELLALQQQHRDVVTINSTSDSRSMSGTGLKILSQQVLADMGNASRVKQKNSTQRELASAHGKTALLNFFELATEALKKPAV